MEVVREWKSRRAPYPWAKWADGKVRKAIAGRDFDGTAKGFAATVRSWSRRNGYRAKVSRAADGDSVTFVLTKRPKTAKRRQKTAQ